MQLLPHSGQAHPHVRGFELEAIRQADGALALRYWLKADVAHWQVPKVNAPLRADRLWLHTCFEAFIAMPGTNAYCELNFSPSGEWAAYAFTSYRAGMTVLELSAAPEAHWVRRDDSLELAVVLEPPIFFPDRGPLRLAASAVLEDQSGTISYWALRHPAGPPDFHHPESFAWLIP